MIKITLPDGSVRDVMPGSTPQEIAQAIGPGLARSVVVAKVDSQLVDLNKKLVEDCSLELFTGATEEGHDTLLHSTAHLMAQAVKNLFPEAKVAIGPTIENGFYYDFDVNTSFSDDVLKTIESKMKELAKSGQEIFRNEISVEKAINYFESIDESYKVEII